MTDAHSAGGDSFDLDKLQQLVEMMEKHDLREVQLRRGDQQWKLKRGPQVPVMDRIESSAEYSHRVHSGYPA